ncbi:hypothetical protein SETIT_J024700v2 [Setaria italica]|uniref:Uncharacterized protein n=1 Tax=Setaria italica TaxID=4555 RepID=A0A368PET0_SETIT|nr:hypothetical protein SETIT_J024700v2 [Setaria italica]
MPITSPVLRISGPRRMSQPWNFSNGRTASLTDTCLGTTSLVKPSSCKVTPDMTNDAYLANGCPIAFDTKGTVREALGFASSRNTSPVVDIAYWQFINPQTFRRFAKFAVHERITSKH